MNTKPKKKSAEWYVAATHWLTSLVLMGIIGVILLAILVSISQNIDVILVGTLLVYPLIMWASVKYSANYINKRYVIVNPNNIVILSTVYLVIVAGGYRVYALLTNPIDTAAIVNIIAFLLALAVFYFGSKKYIQKDIS